MVDDRRLGLMRRHTSCCDRLPFGRRVFDFGEQDVAQVGHWMEGNIMEEGDCLDTPLFSGEPSSAHRDDMGVGFTANAMWRRRLEEDKISTAWGLF